MHKKLKRDIEFLSHHLAFYYNKYRSEEFMLKKRNKVYLLSKNILTTRLSKKLNYIKIKSFKIIRSIKRVSFKLNLFEEIKRKYSVFYILLLKSALLEILVL